MGLKITKQTRTVLQPCQAQYDAKHAESFVMIVFGGAGDLSCKKLLPALYQLFKSGLIKNFAIIATGRTRRTNVEYHKLIKGALKKQLKKEFCRSIWKKFTANLFYESCDISEEATYITLEGLIVKYAQINNTNDIIYYVAVPPKLISDVVAGLGANAMRWISQSDKTGRHESVEHDENATWNRKIVLEKPFGTDQKSAISLNQNLLKVFAEKDIYRIDHYLGKETVQNILFFRFANSIFEPIWNNNYIDHIQITVAEDIGIEGRGQFYEGVGVIRDIVQNHILQLMAMIAMEAPAGLDADLVRNERVKVFQAVRAFKKSDLDNNIVVAQYDKYCKEKNIAPNSKVPTYFAGKFYIDNWRWSDVPFYVRTGKRLIKKETKIVIQFKNPPLKLWGKTCSLKQPNSLTIFIQPQESIAIQFCVKQPGTLNSSHLVNMDFEYGKFFDLAKLLPAYERLLLDCMKGDQTLFAREDGTEIMWHIVDPIIDALNAKKKIASYKPGSWGPKVADELIERDGIKWINED